METLEERIYKVGLFAGVPVVDEDATVETVRSLVKGGVRGIILPWNKRIWVALDWIHTQFPNLLMGMQGPWLQASKTLNRGISFIIGDIPEDVENPPCFKRDGNAIVCPKTQRILADCTNKIALVNDINNADWDRIIRRARAAVGEMLGFELRHVGINNPDEQSADQVAGQFDRFFGFRKDDKGGAFFAGPFIEAMKKPFYGQHGHIAISTHNTARAVWYLEQRGAVFNWDSAGYNEDGSLRVVYLKDEIGGFAVHILQK